MEYFLHNINDLSSEDYSRIYNLLGNKEKDKIDKIRREKDKRLSISGYLLLERELDKQYQISFSSIDIYTNEFGKPFIKNESIFYNISHSGEYCALVIDTGKIGIDIQKVKNIDISVINVFSTKKEKEYILKEDSLRRLFGIWVLKEAYIKFLGSGFIDKNDVEFEIGNTIVCSDKSVLCQLEYFDDYVIAICKEKLNSKD